METYTLIVLVLAATIRVATPLLLAALAGMFSERSGVVDLGLEGKMLGAAFAAAAVSAVTGSAWVGLAAGIGTGMALALLMAFACVTHRGNQVVGNPGSTFAHTGYCRFQIGDRAGPESLQKDAKRPANRNPHVSRYATTVGLVNQEKGVRALPSQGDGLRLTRTEKCCEGRDQGGAAGMSLLDPGGVYQLVRPVLPFATDGHLLEDGWRDEDAPEQILKQAEVP